MSIRLTLPCYQKLIVVSNKSNLSFTEIGNKSIKQFDRLNSDELVASFKKQKDDYNLMNTPTSIRFKPELIKGKSQALIRHILEWALDDFEKKYRKPSPLTIEKDDIELMYRAKNSVELAEEILKRV